MIEASQKFAVENEETKQAIARQVREAMAQIPPLNGTILEVDEQGIYASQISNQLWWRVPIIPRPFPQRLFAVYEVMAEIEEWLRSNSRNDIVLFAGDFAEEESTSA